MSFHLWLAFALASLVIAIIPGPGVASIVGFALSSGPRTALASVAGMAVGNAIAISVSLSGAGAILASSAIAFTVLKYCGALYLIVIGLLAILRSGKSAAPNIECTPITPLTAFLTNVAVGTFHPKTIMFFLAFASQFIRPDQPYVPQAMVLVATFTLIAAATDTLYALAASQMPRRLEGGSLLKQARRLGGGVLVAAGVATALKR